MVQPCRKNMGDRRSMMGSSMQQEPSLADDALICVRDSDAPGALHASNPPADRTSMNL